MTEEQQGGTAPDTDANASVTQQASEQPVGAVAVADEPAETSSAPEIEGSAAPAAEPDGRADARPGDGAIETATSATPVEATATSDAPSSTELAADTAEATEGSAASATPDGAETSDAAAVATGADDGGEAAVEALAAADDPAQDASAGTDAAADSPQASSDAAPADHAPEASAGLDQADTADAPAADDEPEPVAPPRDLGPEPTTMEELLAEQDSDIKSFKHGDVVEGNVVRIDKDEILVDICAKSEGVVSNRELFGRHGGEGQAPLNIGDTVLVYVLQPESPEGHAVLSLRRAGLERKWRAMQEQFETGVIIEAPVIDHNKGGLIVDCGIRGFVPISQIVDFPRRPQNDQPRDAAQEIAEKLQPFVGRKLRLKILEVNRKANRLILSEKVALYEERREKRDELFSSLQVGQKVTGTVRSIAPFGVFIDLGGIDGLVHKSELSWNKVNNPEAGYKVGDEVEAEVIDINHERGRISLSIRRLQPDPWHSTVADFNVGDVIDGTVTKLVNFGAFVRVRDGLEGLIHISELSHQRVAHPGDVVHEGQSLKLKIISLDSERHRLGLSLKQAEEPPARPAVEPGQPGPSAAAGGPRPERRPRPERSYSMSDAVQEPEGGIDNTLASAFAQVRQQLAAAEGDDAAPTAEAAATTEAEVAPTAEVEAEAPAAESEAPEATAQVDAPAEPEAPTETETEAQAEAPVEAEAPTETEAEAQVEAPVEAEAPTETEAQAEAPVEAEAPTETEAQAEAPVEAEAPTEPEAQAEAPVEAEAPTEP
ncbi:MAG: small subunit ribosomal protein, partial [Chloroflexota bacterium]|nr:small subunit ribosomal protein [Chloroflexota bacterium]